ncbi:MAG: AmmeMemoRadiSam system protein B [Planctomycetia bacterium]|nr:AmmeMemoRadiSam system protein B [Planctomycetia bacterium]
MEKVKKPSVAGRFYTNNRPELARQLSEFERLCKKDRDVSSRLVIAPHAGYIYSGQLMSESIGFLQKDVKNIFIFAPSHHAAFIGLALSHYDRWQTPLGELELNKAINEDLESKFFCHYLDDAFEQEHAVEVEVPFIQHYFPEGVRIIPILAGRAVPQKIMDIIDHFYDDPQNAFVISSDLSHFLNSVQARQTDEGTACMIEGKEISRLHPDQACGALGIVGAVLFARKRNFSFIRAGMYNSGDITGDRSRVVGYGSWFLYEQSKEHFLKEYYSDLIRDSVRKAISFGLKEHSKMKRSDLEKIPPVLEQQGACFITLEIEGRLRGCIGSIIARRPLIDDILDHSWNAAFSDPRFDPLSQKEFEKISISISLLSPPIPLLFKSEEEMKDQIRPFRDGLIISDGYRQAVYLPSVWEQLPDKDQFLRNLKIKAGMSPDHFSKSFEAHVFTTEYITGKEKE